MKDRQTTILDLSETLARGDPKAAAELFPLVYDELRALAASLLRAERANHTLQPTALVHEAFLKIASARGSSWSGRDHLHAIAAIAMRQILVNHARDRAALKRGGPDRRRLTLSEAQDPADPNSPADEVDLLALDEALTRLAAIDETQARIVEMRYFAGMPADRVAHVLNTSERTVAREWRMARAWLSAQLRPEPQA